MTDIPISDARRAPLSVSRPGLLFAAIGLAGLALPEGVKDVVPYALLMRALLLFPQGLGTRRADRNGT